MLKRLNTTSSNMSIRPLFKKLTTYLFDRRRPSTIDFSSESLIDEPIQDSIRCILNRNEYEKNSNYNPFSKKFERLTNPSFNRFHYELLDKKLHGRGSDLNTELLERKMAKTIIVKLKENNAFLALLNYLRRFWARLQKGLIDKIPIFDPEQKIVLYWNFMVLFFVVVNVVNIPLLLCFSLEEKNYDPIIWTMLENVPVWIFLTDVIVTLNTSYYSKGSYVKNRHAILKRYMKKTAMLDLVTLFPFFLGKTFDFTDVQILFLFRIFRIPPLFKKLGEYLELKRPYDGIYALFKLYFYVFYMAHIFACVWHLLGYRGYQKQEGNNWLHKYDIEEEEWTVRYICSLYWSFTTMITVGYGDVTPANTKERCYAAAIMVLSCAVFAYSINSVGNIINDLGREELDFKRKIGEINEYMKVRGVTKNVQVKVKRYMEYMHTERKYYQATEILMGSLSKTLKHDVLIDIYINYFRKHRIFGAYFSDALIRKLVGKVKEITYAPDDYIYQEHDEDEKEIFFLVKGEVHIHQNIDRGFENPIQSIKKGEFFGDYSFFTGERREFSARSRNLTTVAYLSYNDFYEICIAESPEDYERYCFIRDKIKLYRQLSILNVKCPSCNKNTHLVNTCPLIMNLPNKQKTISLYISEKEKFQSGFKRKQRKRFNARGQRRLLEAVNKRLQYEEEHLIDLMDDDEEELEEDDSELEAKVPPQEEGVEEELEDVELEKVIQESEVSDRRSSKKYSVEVSVEGLVSSGSRKTKTSLFLQSSKKRNTSVKFSETSGALIDKQEVSKLHRKTTQLVKSSGEGQSPLFSNYIEHPQLGNSGISVAPFAREVTFESGGREKSGSVFKTPKQSPSDFERNGSILNIKKEKIQKESDITISSFVPTENTINSHNKRYSAARYPYKNEDMDRVRNFKFYFPDSNVQELIKEIKPNKVSKLTGLAREKGFARRLKKRLKKRLGLVDSTIIPIPKEEVGTK